MTAVNLKTDIEAARYFAVLALMERLPRSKPEKLDGLRQRIAGVKAGLIDTAPEVVASLLAVQYYRDLIGPNPVRIGGALLADTKEGPANG